MSSQIGPLSRTPPDAGSEDRLRVGVFFAVADGTDAAGKLRSEFKPSGSGE
jgi:hypothetical protein